MAGFDFAAQTDIGLVRETNQDVALVVPELRLGLVADGMGGHDDGGLASRIVADAFRQEMTRLTPSADRDVEATRGSLLHAFLEANRQVAARTNGKRQDKMGTTLVAAVFLGESAILGNVGDSRCYRLRDNELERLTRDHSYATHLEDMGATRTVEGRDAAEKWAHVLTRCVNGDVDVEPDTQVVDCKPGDVFLLCSDGLWGSAKEEDMQAILARELSARDTCRHLVGLAWSGGGLDNIGVVVVRVGGTS